MYKPNCSISDSIATSKLILGQIRLAQMSDFMQMDNQQFGEALLSLAKIVEYITSFPEACCTDVEIDLVCHLHSQFIDMAREHPDFNSLADDDFLPPENKADFS